MQEENLKAENLVPIRCHNCGKVLFEASVGATGTVRKKCENNKCKQFRTINLQLTAKKNNLLPVRA